MPDWELKSRPCQFPIALLNSLEYQGICSTLMQLAAEPAMHKLCSVKLYVEILILCALAR